MGIPPALECQEEAYLLEDKMSYYKEPIDPIEESVAICIILIVLYVLFYS